MELGKYLIDKAGESGLTRYRLSKVLDENQSHLGKIANGSRPIAPGLAARMAVHAGLDARRAALQAVADQEHDPVKRAELLKLFELPDSPPSAGLRTNL